MTTLTMHRRFDAPAPIVWDVISDHELYADAAPNLATVEVVSGEGVGMVRRCVDTDGNEWTETCTRWDDGRLYEVAVDVEESEFHRRLFHRFEGTWGLVDADDGVEVTMAFEFEPKYGPLGVLISKFFEYKAPAIVETIFDRWEAAIESRVSDGATGTRDVEDHRSQRSQNALYR